MNSLLLVSDFKAFLEAITTTAQYASSVANANKEREELLSQFCVLRIVLDEIEDIMSKSDPSYPGYPGTILKLRPYLERCRVDINHVETVLQNRSVSKKMKRIQNLAHCLTWYFTSKKLQGTIQNLRGYQAMFQSILTADTRKLASAQLEHQEKTQQDLKNQKVIDWFSKSSGNCEEKHSRIRNTRAPDTGEWFLKLPELQGFMHSGNDEHRLLWCHGLPGAGKTHLSCFVIDTLKKEADSAVLYWYFDYHCPDEQHHTSVRSSLLIQLIEQLPKIPAVLEKLYNENKRVGLRPNKDILMRGIGALLGEFKHSFVVLDALDECFENSRNEILEIIDCLENMGARMLITSRQMDPGKASSSWVPVEVNAQAEDLRLLIDHKLRDKYFQTWREIMINELKEEIIEAILSKTDGMFLWASLQLNEVLECTTPAEIRSVLDNIPKDISKFFSRSMSRVAANSFALRTVLWLSYTKEPLNFNALSHALSVEPKEGMLSDIDKANQPHIEALVEMSCGLIVKDGEKNLRLAHFSILEYLKSNPQVFERYGDPDLYIARICLRYLSLGVFETRYKYGDKLLGHQRQSYPLLEYAAKRWRWHILSDIQCAKIEAEILHLYFHEGLFNNYIDAYYPWIPQQVILPGQMKSYYDEVPRIPIYNAMELQLPGVIRLLLGEKEFCSLGTNARATLLMRAVRDNRKDLVDMLLKAGVDPSIKGYGPEASSWNTSRDASYGASEPQGEKESLQEEKFFYSEMYPSTLAIIMGHRDIFEMLRDEIKVKDNLDIIRDILTRAIEDKDRGQQIVAEILRHYPIINHRHPIYVRAMEGRRWEIHPNKQKMLQVLLDARPQLDNQDGLLDKLLPSAISYLPDYVPTLLNKGASLNIPNQEFCRALLAAIYQEEEQLAILLVDKGANVCTKAFSEAAWYGMNNLIKCMLEQGYDAGAKGDVSVTSAVAMGNVETLRLLLSRGANVESIGMFEDRTALHIAASEKNYTIVRMLLEKGADPNADSTRDGTPLAIASSYGHEAIVKLLIEYGAEVNYVGVSKHNTALYAAASNCSLQACRLLLDHGADPNCGEALPLLAAIQHKDNISVIEMLLQKGADPMKKICNREYPLERAVYRGQDDIVRLFLKHGATLDACGSRGSILHAAAASEKEGMVQIMLELGAKAIEKKDKFGSILQWARPEDYQLLIDNGVKVNAPILGRRYGTAIQAAISRITDPSREDKKTQEKISKAIGYLVEKAGDDINTMGGFYGSAIQAASSRGYHYIVHLLLHNGASPNVKGGRCGTALQAAAYHGYLDVVNLLLTNGADVNQRSGLYDTALQAAAFQGRFDVVKLLIKHGADVNAQGGKYNSPLDATKQSQFTRQKDVRDILLKYGAVDNGREYKYNWLEDTDDYDKSSDNFDYDEDEEGEGEIRVTKTLQDNTAD